MREISCKENKLEKIWGPFGSYFQELFFVLENKKTCLGKRVCFCFFRILKNHFFENNKKMFSLFQEYIVFRIFFSFFLYFLSCFLCFHKSELHPTITPHSQTFSFSLNYWN